MKVFLMPLLKSLVLKYTLVAFASTFTISADSLRAADPLPSWQDRDARNKIIEYVENVTNPDSDQFIPVPERVAVFDNDGTLWCEAPLPIQLAYVIDEVKKQAEQNPKLKEDPSVAALLDGDIKGSLAGGLEGLLRLAAIANADMTCDEFKENVQQWVQTAEHPRFKRLYVDTVYQPMIEVINYLQANDFKTYIVSGGGADFMRVWSEEVYNIPPEQAIGSTVRPRFELRGDKSVLVRTTDSFVLNDKEGKPLGIQQYIGRRPVMCFGNSDGDKAMLEYTTMGNVHPSLGVIVHHTDADREYAYDKKPMSSGKLIEALEDAPKRGWVVVDMKEDWKKVFPSSKGKDQ